MTVPNDTFARATRNGQASRRPTPDDMGGGSFDGRVASDDAAALLQQGRQAPEIDERASAALARWWEERKAKHYKLNGSAVATTGSVTVIDLGGPKQGFVWAVRRINVGPLDYAGTVGSFPAAVTTILAASQRSPGSAYPANSGQQVIDSSAAFPLSGTWGRGEATVAEGDRLFLLIVGLTTGYQVTAGGEVEETAAGVPELYGL